MNHFLESGKKHSTGAATVLRPEQPSDPFLFSFTRHFGDFVFVSLKHIELNWLCGDSMLLRQVEFEEGTMSIYTQPSSVINGP